MAKKRIERPFPQPAGSLPTGLSAADLSAIRVFLDDLDELKAGLAEEAFLYVLNGIDDDLPRRILEARRALRAHRSGPRDDEKRDAERHIFLELEGWGALAIRRFGQIVDADMRGIGYHYPGSDASPFFFRALFRLATQSFWFLPTPPDPSSWLLTGPRCVELLALDNADRAALVIAGFAGFSLAYGDHRPLGMAGLAETLAEAPEETLAGARALDPKGRRLFIDFLATRGLVTMPPFFDFMIDLVTTGGKRDIDAALRALHSCGDTQSRERAVLLLASARIEDRAAAIRILANLGTPAARSLIEHHGLRETSRHVRRIIDELLPPLRLIEQDASVSVTDGYAGMEDDWIDNPPGTALEPDVPLPADFATKLRAIIVAANDLAEHHFLSRQIKYEGLSVRERPLFTPDFFERPFAVEAIPEFIDIASGKIDPRDAARRTRKLGGTQTSNYPVAGREYVKQLEAMLDGAALTAHHLARLSALTLERPQDWVGGLLGTHEAGPAPWLLGRMAVERGDYRPVLEICASSGCGPRAFVAHMLDGHWGTIITSAIMRRRDALWPLVADHLDLIDQALGIAAAPPGSSFQIIRALDLLTILPAPPRRYLQTLIDLSVGGQRDHKSLARALLAKTRGVTDLILPLLHTDNDTRRINAADWLRARRDPAAIPALRAALTRETSDAGRAMLLSALIACGDDISDQVSQERLLEQAEAGLAKTRSTVGAFVPLDRLPTLRWQGGHEVPDPILRWWIILADRLKTARGNPMLNLVLDRLSKESAERLGEFVLSCFVSDGETAINHRGILALAYRARGSEAVDLVKDFFRNHHLRRHECRALLDALSNIGTPITLEFLDRIARRDRTSTNRKHAARLVKTIAEERGWTADEIADSMVSSGGLDEDGFLRLAVGGRRYSASLDARLHTLLHTPEGKTLSATLPADDDDTAKALAELRKIVTRTVRTQTGRLYDAMCAGRVWQPADINACLFRHPIVSRLCRRLIFAGIDADGAVIQTFRPRDSDQLVDASDDSVEIARFAGIRIAHRAALTDHETETWQRSLPRHKIIPLFEQLARPVLAADGALSSQTSITDREGHMVALAKLHRVIGKLGYVQEDGEFAAICRKSFPMAGCVALIDFVGGQLPQSAAPCALVGLRFERLAADRTRPETLRLSAVPPILLSEAWNDFHAIAAAGSGFDPAWRMKARW
jgi:hypothetical protein